MTWSIFFFSRKKKKKNKTLDNDDGDNRPETEQPPEPGLVTVTILEHLSLCVFRIFRNSFGFFKMLRQSFHTPEKFQQPGQIERRRTNKKNF